MNQITETTYKQLIQLEKEEGSAIMDNDDSPVAFQHEDGVFKFTNGMIKVEADSFDKLLLAVKEKLTKASEYIEQDITLINSIIRTKNNKVDIETLKQNLKEIEANKSNLVYSINGVSVYYDKTEDNVTEFTVDVWGDSYTDRFRSKLSFKEGLINMVDSFLEDYIHADIPVFVFTLLDTLKVSLEAVNDT